MQNVKIVAERSMILLLPMIYGQKYGVTKVVFYVTIVSVRDYTKKEFIVFLNL